MRCGMVRIRGGSVGRGECKVMCGEPQTGWGEGQKKKDSGVKNKASRKNAEWE